ncbi:MAG: hypothetical protein EP343_23245 [Deltaproteobacteria bacterium]|nr:MAG: hypothetical protein EP343_23245 [Deltaproteobacteria bacterium]
MNKQPINILKYFVLLWLGFGLFACGEAPTEPCEAKTVRTCKCIGPRVNDVRQCILGQQTCKPDGTGYIPCRCIPEDTGTTKADPIVSCEGDPHPPKPSS